MDDARARLALLSDDDLEHCLFDLAGHIAWPVAPDLVTTPAAQVSTFQPRFERRRLWLAAAIAIAAIGVGLLLSQGFRDSVAGVFGVRGIEIDILRDDEPEASPAGIEPTSSLAIGRPVSQSETVTTLPFTPLLPDALGDPDGLYIRTLPGGDPMLSAAYLPRDDLPESAETGIGLLLMQFESEFEAPQLIKSISNDFSNVVEIDVHGADGYWIEGVSQLTILSDPSVGINDSVIRPSANVLIWQEDGVTYRMESSLELTEALEIAESMQPVETP